MAVTTGTTTRSASRRPAGSAAPLTVRILEGRLFLCAPTEDQLAAPTDDAGIDAGAAQPVPVLLDDGSTAQWTGAPVVGSLRFVDWLVRTRPTVDVTVTAVAALIVEAVELTTLGELVPDLATDTAERTWSWRPAPSIESAGRIGKVWFAASQAVADGDPDEVLHGWFATAVAELASARLGPPPIHSTVPEPRVHRWADQVTARASAGARLRFHVSAPDDLDGHFLLLPRFESLTDPSVVLPPLGPDTADLLGTSPHDAVTLLACEWDIARRAWSELPENPADQLVVSPGAVAALLEDGIGALDASGISVHLPSALLPDSSLVRRVTITGASSGLDAKTLALTGEVLVDGDPLTDEELEVLARARGELVAVRGRWLRIDEETRAATLAFTKRVAEGNPSTADVLELAATADEVDVDAVSGWVGRALAGEFKPTPAERVKTPKTITATLRHYQEDGLAWLAWLEANGLGGILADDMGLGKTAQALAIIAHDLSGRKKPKAPTLVVAPTSVVSNWLREAEQFAPKLRVVLHHGSARQDPSAYIGTADVVVTSYGVMRRDEPLREIGWHRVVLDEAQAIKNPSTATTKAARKLEGAHRLVVTGTPVENHLGELWSLMSWANPGLLGTQAAFKSRYADYVGTAAGADALAALRKRIAPFVLRRHKTDPGIADELPERIIVRDDCTLTREQAALYQAVVEDMKSDVADATGMKRRGKVLAGITKLKQICNHPATITDDDGTSDLVGRSGKLDRLVELTREIIDEGEAVVVFSQYATFLRRVAEHLRTELDIGVENLDGKMARPARDKAVARFGEDGGPPVLCVSLKAGGTGLNLVRANHVIHFDRWWNPAVEDQASDRVWRIGQTRGVVVHTLVCPGTLEERIADLLDQKRSLAQAVVASSPEQLISELDDAALAALVELDADRAGGLV
ncbi:MAG TPA: DEAD/DEAH box helicase [Acidimicrobiia bacterium]|jgi:superfamily II DNA or RNA helicase